MPFKRGESNAKLAASATAKDAGAAAADGEPVPGVAFEALTASVVLEGVTLRVADGAGAMRAALAYAAGNGKAALVVTQTAEGALALEQSELRDGAWSTLKPVASLEASVPDGSKCAAKTVSLHALGASYALVDADVACESAAAAASAAAVAAAAAKAATEPPAPSGSDVAAPALRGGASLTGSHAARHLWIATRDATARVVQHIEVDSAQSPDAPRIEPALQSRDLDGDGRSDLLLALNVGIGDQPPTRIELKLFDRAGGLAPSNDEPEKTLLDLAEQAKNERKRNPNAAFEIAQRTLAVHAVLCRESATSRLRIGGRGLDCGPSLGAGRAATVLIAALAAQGKVLNALSLYQTLERRAYRLTDNDRERARVALLALVDSHGLSYRQGPQVEPRSSMRVRRSAIAFIDEGHLLLRGRPTRSYDLATGAIEAIGIAADAAITSPDGRFTINAIVRA